MDYGTLLWGAWLLLSLALALLLWLWMRRRRRPAGPVLPPPEIFTAIAPTATLHGIRYRNPGFPPVLLVHGYAGNSRNWREMGYALHERGYDVWMPNLRGHGKGTQRSVAFGGQGAHGFTAIAVQDLPALVEHVTEATGRRVALVCHSMGGIAARAYLSGVVRDPDGRLRVDSERARRLARDRVSALVLVGSPPHFRNFPGGLKRIMGQPALLLELFHSVAPIPDADRAPTAPDRGGLMVRLRQTVVSQVFWRAKSTPLLRGIVELGNFDQAKREFPRLVEKGLSKIHVDLVRDFNRWIRDGRMTDESGFDFSEPREIFLPLLFIAGELDQLAPHADVEEAAASYGRFTDSRYILVRDTSHVDLVAGERAAALLADRLAAYLIDPWSLGPPGQRVVI